jgi:hypothetical protein
MNLGYSFSLKGVRNASYVVQWIRAASFDLKIKACVTITSNCYLFVVRSVSSSEDLLTSEDRLCKMNLFSTGRKDMEALFYQTQDLDLAAIAQALVLEYQAKGHEAQKIGDSNNMTVQLKQENTLRMITGFNKAPAVSLERLEAVPLCE